MNICLCLYVDGFELVWLFIKFEWKMRKLWFLVENELGDEFEVNWGYDSKFVIVLNAF